MLTRGRLLPILALAGVLAACGGSSATPTAGTAPAPPPTGADAVTISPFEADGDGSAAAAAEPVEAIFPAETPAGVLALAAQHPNGRITYATILDGVQGELTLVRQGERGMIALTRDTGTVRVGVDLARSSMLWVCVSESGGEPVCRDRDFKGNGADALAAAALLIGEDRVRQIASRVAAADDGNLAVQTRANGVDASCLSGSDADAGRLLACVSPSGFVTDTEEGGTIARASQVSPDVDPQELTPAGIGQPTETTS